MYAVLVSLPDFKVRIYARFGKNQEFLAYPLILLGKTLRLELFESKKTSVSNLQTLMVVRRHEHE